MENKFDTNKFMKIVGDFITARLNEFNIDPEEFLYKYNPNNKKVHDTIIRLMSTTFKSPEELKSCCPDKEICHLYNTSFKHGVSDILVNYFNDFINLGFIDFKSSSITKDKKIEFDSKQPYLYYREKIKNNKYKSLPMFIIPDGKCYYSPAGHDILSKWLYANSIEISNAIRFDLITSSTDSILIGNTGLYNKYNDNQEEIIITKEQAQTLSNLYKTLADAKKLRDINESLVLSEDFGFDTLSKTGKKNISTLIDAFGKGYIDIKEIKYYQKEYNL